MSNIKNETPKKHLSGSHRVLVKNSVFSFLQIYSGFFLSLVTSFLLARMITQELWGYLIFGLSYTSIFSIILVFFPPSFGTTINYYVATFHSLEQNNQLKSFVKNSLILRSLFILLFYGIAIIFFIWFKEIFEINLGIYTHLFLILSPLIIFRSLNFDIYQIYRGLNIFNLILYLLLLNYGIQIGGFLILLIFQNLLKIEIIAFITLLSSLIPFLINIIYLIIKIRIKIKKTQEPTLKFRAVATNLYKYGTAFSIKDFGDNIVREIQTQAVSSPEIVTGYSIGINFSNAGVQSVNSLANPLAVSFTRLYAQKRTEKIIKTYQTIFHYVLFGLLFVSGFLFFLSDIFLFLIYGELYLDYSIILKIMIISIIFNIQNIFFNGLIRAMNKGILNVPLYLILAPIKITFFILLITYYGIISALIFSFAFNLLNFIILFILISKIFKIKPNIIKTVFQYSTLIISLGLTILLEFLFLKEFNIFLLNLLNLNYFKHFNFFSLLTFCFSYIIFNLIFKIIKKNDLDNIEALLVRENYLTKTIKKVLNIFKKLVRE